METYSGTVIGYSDDDEFIIVQMGDGEITSVWVGQDIMADGFEDGVDADGYPKGTVIYW
jgi:hypothetical protein